MENMYTGILVFFKICEADTNWSAMNRRKTLGKILPEANDLEFNISN